MNDSLLKIEIESDREPSNPLLKIDTNFRTYLRAYTRSSNGHLIGGTLDYAFDSDYAVRQKIVGLPGWGKLSKAIMTQDVTEEAKFLFLKVNQAGSLKYPEVYEIAKMCAERLELILPTVFVRDDTDKKIIYSISSDIIEPCIVLTESLIEMCTSEELQLLIGSECGRIQNNHSIYNMAYKYFNCDKRGFIPAEQSYHLPVSNQLIFALAEWVKLADVTADRAGMICCDEPERYCEILASIYEKGYRDFYSRCVEEMNFEKLVGQAQRIHYLPARNIIIEKSTSADERRMLASVEFLNCDVLYDWRKDISNDGMHVINGQLCDARCNIIIGTANAEV